MLLVLLALCAVLADYATADAALITGVDESVFDPRTIDDVHVAVVRRYRGVYIDPDRLRTKLRETASAPSTPLELELFPDVVIRAEMVSTETFADGPRKGIVTWSGHVPDEEAGSVMLTLSPDGAIYGTIDSRRGHYRIIPSDGIPYAAIVEVDRSIPITAEMLLEEQRRLGR